MSKLCYMCIQPLAINEYASIDSEMKNIIETNIQTGNAGFEYLLNRKSVAVHVKCLKKFKCIIAGGKPQYEEETAIASKICPPNTVVPVKESYFSFRKCCLFCGDKFNKEYEKEQAQTPQRKISKVKTRSFQDSVMKVAQSRSDDFAKAIITRIGVEQDLIAVKAKYHKDCSVSFLKPINQAIIADQADHCQEEALHLAMEDIFTYIERSDDCQFTLEELKNVCKNCNFDSNQIKLRLKLKYGDRITITEKPVLLTFISFLNNKHDTLNQACNEKTNPKSKEERLKILAAAATIIQEDIESQIVHDDLKAPSGPLLDLLKHHITESQAYF